MKIGKYCPVCEKVRDKDLDFCPIHPRVLMVRIRDWGDGYKIYTTKAFDQQDDDFNMNEGLEKEQNPLIVEWKRRKTDK